MAKIVIDGTRAETARTVVVAAFAAVAIALLGALGVHKFKTRGLSMDLPGRLGANIAQTANGFTYSQSQQGHTVFTIHAASVTEYKGDEVDLHGVEITLYGPLGSKRKDRIAGQQFRYNKATGEIAAAGPVRIDLASLDPTAAADQIHVETSDLRYSQKTGRAVTESALAFTVPRGTGKAVGGAYDGHTGVLVLNSAIELHALENGAPVTTEATHAEISRDARVGYLLNVHSIFSGVETAADQAILHFRPDGTLFHVDAENRVSVLTAEGGRLHATNASADLDEHAEPLTVFAGGGVNYHAATPDLEEHGNAVESTLSFAPGPGGKQILSHAEFRNAVSFVVQQNSLNGDPRGLATREITASTIDIEFGRAPDGRAEAESMAASGGVKVDLHDLPFNQPQRHTSVYAGLLHADLKDGRQLRALVGNGGTRVVDYAPDGATDTSSADALQVSFLPESEAHEPGSKSSKAALKTQSAVIEQAEQTGHVLVEAAPARDAKTASGAPQTPVYAEGARAVYHAADSLLRLTGDPAHPPRVHDDTLALTASEIDLHRDTGEAAAIGDVRATSVAQPGGGRATPTLGGAGAVHVVASSAALSRGAGTAAFSGDARIWQGANSVNAPMLVFEKQGGVLHALGPQVHTVFSGQGVTRVTSNALFYADSTRTANFEGPVLAQQPGGEFRADAAQVFLSEAPPGRPSALDRMVATGRVTLTEPGRRGTGDRLVYTAADGSYVLTGGPPRASDSVHGAVTGAELLFKPGDEFVQVLNREAAGDSRRTVTDTRTPK